LPCYIYRIIICSLSFRPIMKIKESLNYVIVLYFSISLFWMIWKPLIASKHEMTNCNLVVSSLGIYWQSIIKNIDPEIFWLFKLLSILKNLNIHCSTSMISRTYHNLLLEDYSIFCRNIIIDVLKWFTLNNLC